MRDRLFLPETIVEALDTDLATGLRAIADALDSGQLDGNHLGTMAVAGGRNDERIHLRVSLAPGAGARFAALRGMMLSADADLYVVAPRALWCAFL